MPITSRPCRPGQMLLLAPDLHQWLDEGHLAYHVSDLVDALDLGAFYARYEGDGRRNSPYEPSMIRIEGRELIDDRLGGSRPVAQPPDHRCGRIQMHRLPGRGPVEQAASVDVHDEELPGLSQAGLRCPVPSIPTAPRS